MSICFKAAKPKISILIPPSLTCQPHFHGRPVALRHTRCAPATGGDGRGTGGGGGGDAPCQRAVSSSLPGTPVPAPPSDARAARSLPALRAHGAWAPETRGHWRGGLDRAPRSPAAEDGHLPGRRTFSGPMAALAVALVAPRAGTFRGWGLPGPGRPRSARMLVLALAQDMMRNGGPPER